MIPKKTSRRKSKSKSNNKGLFRKVGYAILAFIALIVLFIITVYWGWFGAIPGKTELSQIRQNQATEVYSGDGEVLGKYYYENRVIVPMDKISPWLVKALIATEDARFFSHKGIDFRSLARVLFKTVLLQDASQGGGSTLSQQLAKNLYPRDRQKAWMTIPSKVREMIIARRLEGIYDKEELLHLYLNTVPFGDNIYGVEVASWRYFNLPAATLSVPQAALLVGMLKANSAYHPVRNPEKALERRNIVMRRMMEQSEISAGDYQVFKASPLAVKYSKESHHSGLAAYFREHLRIELDGLLSQITDEKGGTYNLYSDGLRVYTTLDARMQRYAEKAVQDHLKVLQAAFNKEWKDGKPWGKDQLLESILRQSQRWKAGIEAGMDTATILKQFDEVQNLEIFTWDGPVRRKWTPRDSLKYTISLLHAGLVAGNPENGQLLVWVGGIDHKFFEYDQVKARRPSGSVFKPIVYAAALEAGFDPCDYLENTERSYEEYQGWTPRNASQEQGGVYTMAGAISNSLNTIAAALLMDIGTKPVRELAMSMGLQGPIPDQPSIALGTADASALEILSLYGTLANQGVRPNWYAIKRIENSRGEILYEKKIEENQADFERVIPEDHALILRHGLQMAVDSGTARSLRDFYGLRADLAGKTGTTQDHGDGWFAAYSSSLVAVSRVGAMWPGIHFKSLRHGSGSRTALPIVAKLWLACDKDTELRKWVRGSFTPLPEYLAQDLNCPPYLPTYPELEKEGGGLLAFLGLTKGEEELEDKPQGTHSRPSEASERIRKKNEKIKKKRKRKEAWKGFWDDVLGRD